MSTIRIVVLGEPMGKQRPKFSNAHGFVKTYTPKETTNYESLVVNEYRKHQKEKIFKPHEEIWATIVAYFKIPKQHYHYHKRTNSVDLDKDGELMKKGLIRPKKTPDCDNIAKICLDALNDIAYPDDSQITTLLVLKYYSEDPRVEITLESRENYEEKNY